MTADVIPLRGRSRADHIQPQCGCCEHGTCYPHRVQFAADRLRAMPTALEGDAWVMRADVRRLAADVLAELDAITAETLPDERVTK